MLQAGVALIHIRDILGHVDIRTTEVYARSDLEMKRKALQKAADSPDAVVKPSQRNWHENKDSSTGSARCRADYEPPASSVMLEPPPLNPIRRIMTTNA